jgi:hypothetical protein
VNVLPERFLKSDMARRISEDLSDRLPQLSANVIVVAQKL